MANNQLNFQRIKTVISFLIENFKTQPSLDMIAQSVHCSPYHFHRIFTEWVGLSPKKFMSYLTIDYLRSKIRETHSIMEAAELVGLSSQSRVHDLFLKIDGVSPQQFKSSGVGLIIYYGYHPTPIGLCFIAVSERGICGLSFVDKDESGIEFVSFSEKWKNAKILYKPDFTQPFINEIFHYNKKGQTELDIYLRGTPFQIKVWEAMLKIPYGGISSYKQVAKSIGHPQAVRAVGAAVKANPVLFLIPCHRVIFDDGELGNYQNGRARKQALIVWEALHS